MDDWWFAIVKSTRLWGDDAIDEKESVIIQTSLYYRKPFYFHLQSWIILCY